MYISLAQLYDIYKEHPSICTDSRRVDAGCLFIALRGDRFDGNAYAQQALDAGAAYAVVDDPALVGERFLLVEDALSALQGLARLHRRQLAIPVIAITGTNGKTTTKELTAAVLQQSYQLLYTEGNLNNHIGLPLTLLRLRQEHQLALVEMGASKPGDIAELCAIAEPNYGIITNIGAAHLEGFGSIEGVASTKGELYEYLRHRTDIEGIVFRRSEDERLARLAGDLPSLLYGASGDLLVQGAVPQAADSSSLMLRFSWSSPRLGIAPVEQQTQLVGAYNLDNALCAIAVGLYFDVPSSAICSALSSYTPSNSRSQLIEGKRNRLIVDAYNANPSSMATAVRNLFASAPDVAHLLILGDMNELGADSHQAHLELRDLVTHHISPERDRVIYCGDIWSVVLEPYGESVYRSAEELSKALEQEHLEGYLVLIKGSNSLRLTTLVPYL